MSFTVNLEPLLLGGLMMGRILTFIVVVPAIGMRTVPAPVKIALAVWLTVAGVPAALANTPTLLPAPGPLALAFAGEFLVGMLLSFTVLLIFTAFQMGGQLAGMQIGFTIVNAIDPQTQSQISVMSQLYYLVAALAFVALNGHLIVLKGIYDSFAVFPPGTAIQAPESIMELVLSVGGIFKAALRIAAPPVISLLLVSITLGVIGRTVSQLNVLVVGFPLKILVGLIMASLSLPFVGQYLGREFDMIYVRVVELAAALGQGG